MKIILGLGNPGLRFRFSRHNLGFLVVEALARAKKIKIKQKTFMNLSREAVTPLVKQKKIKLADLLIVCDDVNLPLGKIRIRAKGSDGGHKGLRSIIEGLKSEDFPRLRIGVGAVKAKSKKFRFTEYVLGRFNKKEIKVINEAIEKAVSCCQTWAKAGMGSAMNRFNRR